MEVNNENNILNTKILICYLLGVLGLCAIVLSSPYDIPNHVPEALMLLCEHSHDPDLIQVCFGLFINSLFFFEYNF